MTRTRVAWREPTRSLRLVWGSYEERYLGGIVLTIAGAVHLSGSNTYTLNLLLAGTITHVVGWAIMPARGWRRIVAVIPGVAVIWLLLTGPLSIWMFAGFLLGWLLVRHRPLLSYVTLLLPVANGIVSPVFFTEYSQMVPALALATVVLVASAWLARLIAASALVPANRRPA